MEQKLSLARERKGLKNKKNIISVCVDKPFVNWCINKLKQWLSGITADFGGKTEL